MSADVLAEDEAESAGLNAFIPKPVDPNILCSYLDSISTDSNTSEADLREEIAQEDLSEPKAIAMGDEIKVLVVDDQAIYRTLMKQVLKRSGLDVSFAEDGIECLEFLETQPELDAIFLDLRMPHMDGRAVARSIREGRAGDTYTNIPIALVSAEILNEADVEQIGANSFFSKPIDFDGLQVFVDKVKRDHQSVVPPSNKPARVA